MKKAQPVTSCSFKREVKIKSFIWKNGDGAGVASTSIVGGSGRGAAEAAAAAAATAAAAGEVGANSLRSLRGGGGG